MSLLVYPTASYDPACTTIRLCYDPEQGTNVVDDPAVAHELAHYGQNIGTALGTEQTLMWHELFVATAQMLKSNGALELPLARSHRHLQLQDEWDRADLARIFLEDAIGTSSGNELDDLGKALPDLLRPVVGGALTPGSPNPFFINFRAPGPGFGVRIAKGPNLFFRLNGHFIQETHAHATEFLARWAHEKLSLDEAIEAFLSEHARPQTLLYFLVQKLITERLGKGIYDVQDCVAICHISCHLALNNMCVTNHTWPQGICAIERGKYKYSYRDPGHVFLAVLSSCLDQFVEPGWGLEGYFDLMGASLVKLGWPTFEEMMTRLAQNIIGPWADSLPGGDSDWYNTYLRIKLEDSKTLLDWLVKCARQNDVTGFLRAPLELIAKDRLTGPILSGPESHKRLSGKGGPGPSTGQIGGLIIGLLLRKLWYGSDLTCLEFPGGPYTGSVIGCVDAPECLGRVTGFGGFVSCASPTWIECIARFPGLAARLHV
jgi:hypothetical protein